MMTNLLFFFNKKEPWIILICWKRTWGYMSICICICCAQLKYLTDPVCQSWRLWPQTVSRQSTSLHSAHSEMFISKATCAAQPVVRRMSHPQATNATSEVGSGQAPGGECGGAEKHCWAITALLTFCHIVSQQETLSGKGNCKSLSTKVAPTVIYIDKGRRATKPIF